MNNPKGRKPCPEKEKKPAWFQVKKRKRLELAGRENADLGRGKKKKPLRKGPEGRLQGKTS